MAVLDAMKGLNAGAERAHALAYEKTNQIKPIHGGTTSTSTLVQGNPAVSAPQVAERTAAAHHVFKLGLEVDLKTSSRPHGKPGRPEHF